MKTHLKNSILIKIIIGIMITTVSNTVFSQTALRQLENMTNERINVPEVSGYEIQENTHQMTAEDYNNQYTSFIRDEANRENEIGIEYYLKSDWKNAAKHFKIALKYMPDDINIQKNYNYSKYRTDEQKRKEEEISAQLQKEKEKEKINTTVKQTVEKDKKYYNAQLRKLENESYHIKVPMPGGEKKTINEGVMLGLFNTNENNAFTDTSLHIVSPFNKKPIDRKNIFATTDNKSVTELARGFVDNNYLGEYTLNTEHGRKLVEQLNGTHFNRLIAHSNGATISEALIIKDVISVDELNIVGGDRSLINYGGYKELLATGKVKRIVVWINPGDVIPVGSTAGFFSPLEGSRNQYYISAMSYFGTLLSGNDQSSSSQLEYRYMLGNQYSEGQNLTFDKDFFKCHGIDAYFKNMNTFFNKP